MKNGLLDLREEFGNLGSANLLRVCLGEMKQPELRFFESIESIKNVWLVDLAGFVCLIEGLKNQVLQLVVEFFIDGAKLLLEDWVDRVAVELSESESTE